LAVASQALRCPYLSAGASEEEGERKEKYARNEQTWRGELQENAGRINYVSQLQHC